MTCFGGGYNKNFLETYLNKINVDFILTAEGLDDLSITKFQPVFFINNTDLSYSLKFPANYVNFFTQLRQYFGESETFVKEQQEAIKKSEKTGQKSFIRDPLGKILSNVCDYDDVDAITN